MHQRIVLAQELIDIQRSPKDPQMGDSRLINYKFQLYMSMCISLGRQSEVYNGFIKGLITIPLPKNKNKNKKP